MVPRRKAATGSAARPGCSLAAIRPGHAIPGRVCRGQGRGLAELAGDAALGELRAAGWPAPEDLDSGEDTELGGRDTIADRLSHEVSWLRQCAD